MGLGCRTQRVKNVRVLYFAKIHKNAQIRAKICVKTLKFDQSSAKKVKCLTIDEDKG